MSPRILPSEITTTGSIPTPTAILAQSTLLSSLRISTSSTLPSTTSSYAAPPSPTSAATQSISPPASMLDPPTAAGITIGVLVGGVAIVFVVGSLINWIHQKRSNRLRKQLEESYRWHSERPPDPPRPGGSISGPVPRPDDQQQRFNTHPKMTGDPYAGYRVDPDKIGLAVSPDSRNDSVGHIDAVSVSSTANLIPVVGKQRVYNSHPIIRAPSRQEKRLTVFEEDDPSMTSTHDSQPSHEDNQDQRYPQHRPSHDRPSHHRPSQDASFQSNTSDNMPSRNTSFRSTQEGTGLERSNSQPYKSSLRPRGTQLPPSRSTSRRTPPPLETTLNTSGVPLIRVRPPTIVEGRPSLRVTSNAHAPQQAVLTPESEQLSPPKEQIKKSTMKPSSEEPRYPSYVPDYYTSNSPRTPMTGNSQPSPNSYTPSPKALTPKTPSTASSQPPKTTTTPSTTKTVPTSSPSPPLSTTSTETSFESLNSVDITPPTDVPQISPHTTPISSFSTSSPLHGLRYPKIPRPSAQIIPRSQIVPKNHTKPPNPPPNRPLPALPRKRPVRITTGTTPSPRKVPPLSSGKSSGREPSPGDLWTTGGCVEMIMRSPGVFGVPSPLSPSGGIGVAF